MGESLQAGTRDDQLQWFVYVKWTNGKRETILTAEPRQLQFDRLWVVAQTPVPKVTIGAAR